MTRAALRERVNVLAVAAVLFALVIAAGVALRFDNLGGKAFYEDEAITALRVSGYQEHADLRTLFDGRIRSASVLTRLQRVPAAHGPSQTVRSIVAEDTHHGPLFYLMDWLVVRIFGSSVVTFRVTAAILGVLSLFAAWLLGEELFGKRTGAVFAAIVALSPFQVLYAHEAREYTLNTLMTLLTSDLVLRALRDGRARIWAAYGICASLALYGDVLMSLVIVAQALFVLFAVRTAAPDKRAFCFAAAAAVLAYLPWLMVMLRHSTMVSTEMDWGATAYPLRQFVEKWAFNVSAQFFDLEWLSLKFAIAGAVIILFAIYAFVVLVRTATRREWSFVLLLGGVVTAVFLGRDLAQHAHWSTTARYMIPAWISVQLAVAYALGRWCFDSPQPGRAKIGACALAALLICEGVSSAIGTRADSWYDDALNAAVPHLAAAVNAAPQPALLIGEKGWAFFLDAANYLDGSVRVELFADARHARIRTAGYSQVFATTPTPALRAALARDGYRLIPVYEYVSGSSAYVSFHKSVASRRQAAGAGSPSFPNALFRVVRGHEAAQS